MPSIHYVEQDVNIYALPMIHNDLTTAPGDQLIIGDLHANTMKLIYMLVRHSVLRGVSEKQYEHLVEIYWSAYRRELTQSSLKTFFNYLMSFQYVAGSEIILIGDDLADRGACDYLTLLLYQVLQLNRVRIKVLLSNHSIEAIEPMERLLSDSERIDLPFVESRVLDTRRLASGVSSSLESMNHLIAENIISLSDVASRYSWFYRNNLQLVSYLEDEGKLIILSHAPIGLNIIKALANHPKISVDFDDTSINALKSTIDKINLKVMSYIQQNQLHSLYSGDVLQMAYMDDRCDLRQYPFEFCLWNRRFSHLECPPSHNGYSLQFIHGHCENTALNADAINLNTPLGQGTQLLSEYSMVYVTSQSLTYEIIRRNSNIRIERRVSLSSVPTVSSFSSSSSDIDDLGSNVHPPPPPPSSPSLFISPNGMCFPDIESFFNPDLMDRRGQGKQLSSICKDGASFVATTAESIPVFTLRSDGNSTQPICKRQPPYSEDDGYDSVSSSDDFSASAVSLARMSLIARNQRHSVFRKGFSSSIQSQTGIEPVLFRSKLYNSIQLARAANGHNPETQDENDSKGPQMNGLDRSQ